MFGIPLFKEEFMYTRQLDQSDLIARMENMNFADFKVNLEFKNLEDNFIGFREQFKIFQFGRKQTQYTPVMRGLIQINRFENKVVVKGLGNWAILIMPLFFSYIALTLHVPMNGEIDLFKILFSVFPFALLGFIYYKQSKVYNKLIGLLKSDIGILGTSNSL